MKRWPATTISYILLGAIVNGLVIAVEIERGFPTACGDPAIRRKSNDKATRMKTRPTPHSWPWHGTGGGDSGGGLFCPSANGNGWFWYGVLESTATDGPSDYAVVTKVRAVHDWLKLTAISLGL
ncbi:hypothetical protein SprV_0702309900 [Sparganum proliferum]